MVWEGKLGHGLGGVLVHPPRHIRKPNFFQAPRCIEHEMER